MAPRLAWFSPLPPVRSGIAAYSADLLPLLSPGFSIDAFVDEAVPHRGEAGAATGTGIVVLPAHEFVTRHALAPYDLVVYQLGNATCHDYMWPYLLRYPGLIVLHDAGLHHSRARLLLARGRKAHYRAEFRYAHPDAPPEAAEFAIAGLAGSPYYLWPLTRLALESGRVVAVHSPGLGRMLEGGVVPVRVIRMGVPAPGADRVAAAGAGDPGSIHARRPVGPPGTARPGMSGTPSGDVVVGVRPTGIDADDSPLVFACFGLVTPEKRIGPVLRAFAPVAAARAGARLVLVGDTSAHYDVRADIAALGLESRVDLTGFVDEESLEGWLATADVCLCLRWPTARETSASWLRCLAAGKPTVITDLVHTTEVPVLDPRSWTLAHAETGAAAAQVPPSPRHGVAVAIDILDEDHSLGRALQRLSADAALRVQLGRNARAFWAAGHTLEHMAEDYRRVIAEALGAPAAPPAPDRPAHLTDDGTGTAKAVAGEVGVEIDW